MTRRVAGFSDLQVWSCWLGLASGSKDWRLIWTNKPGRGYCERAEQDSGIHISAEVDKDQITVGADGLRMATSS